MGRRLRRAVGLVALLALAGCTAPPTAGVTIPTYSPRREALSYFPAGAPIVALISTDAQEPGLRRLAASGALKPLARAAARHGVYYSQLRGLLGNDAVVGLPHVGGPPLAVLTTPDGVALDTFAQARVIEHRAAPAGRYRGTDLYREDGWAFGVRDRVLLVGASVAELLEALDTRVGDGAFDPAQLSAVLPRELPAAAFVRGYVDLRPLIEAGGPALRAIPVLRALGAAGYALGATPVELRGTVAADTAGAGLTGIDLPLLKRAAGTRPALPDHAPALAVADLSALAAAAERALRTALPVSALRLDALRARLRAAGVALNADLLAGPAEVIRTPRGPQLRLQPSHPAAVAQALARAARRLHGAHLRITRDGPLYVARDGKRVLLRLGLVNGSLVAGRAPAAALVALARQPLSSLHSPAVARLPRLADWYPRPVVLALGGSTRKLRVDVFSGF